MTLEATTTRRPQAKTTIVLVLLIYLAVGRAPHPAIAGTYKLYTCNVPGHKTPVPTVGPWTWELDNLNTIAYTNCATGGTFGIKLNSGQRFMRQTTSASLVLRRPSEGPLSRIGIVRYKTWLIAQLSGSGAPAFISDGGAFGPPGGANSDANPWVSPLFTQTNQAIAVQLYCSAGAPADCFFDSDTPLQARGIEVDLHEEMPPSATIDGGSLLNGPPRGPYTLSYSASDQESGLARVEALLGDVVVGRDDLEADRNLCPHTGFNACPGVRSSDMNLDTSSVAAGGHALALRVTDAAGNRRIVAGPRVTVGENGDKGEVRLAARFAGTGRLKHTSRFGRRVVIRGRLTDRQGRGIADTDVLASERVALPKASYSRERRLRTNASGSFRYSLSRQASSRKIRVRYEGMLLGRRVATFQNLELKVRAAARIKVSLRGVRVHYNGRVLATPLPPKGKLVHMQGRAKGGAWQTFAVKRTTTRGRFAGTYQLRVYRPGVRLEFRVRVPSENRYPFVTGAGRVIKRTVR